MKRYYFLLLFFLVASVYSCKNTSNLSASINVNGAVKISSKEEVIDFNYRKKLTDKIIKKLTDNKSYIQTAPSQIDPYFVYNDDGIEYIIAYDFNFILSVIICIDRGFETTDKLKINTDYHTEEIKNTESQWYLYGDKTIDGWYPILEDNQGYKVVGFIKYPND